MQQANESFFEQTTRVLEQAKKVNESIACFNYICEERALKKAKELDAKNARGEALGKLAGVFVSVKDSVCVEGMPSTAGSALLKNYLPPFSATVVERVEREDGIIIGKTAMDEFGFGSFSTNVGVGFSTPRNPLDASRVCGGSSGGSAASVAAGLPIVSIAESTGGSISSPASFCGVVGITPTYGRVSRWGLIDYASSLDKIGSMGKNVREASALLEVMQGFDERDLTSSKTTLFKISEAVSTARLVVPQELLDSCSPGVQKVFLDSLAKFESSGFSVAFERVPLFAQSIQAYYVVAMAEASTNLARYCGVRYGLQADPSAYFQEYFSSIRANFGREAKRRILLGSFVRTAGYAGKYYWKALKIRAALSREFQKLLLKYDGVISPSMPLVAPSFEDVKKLSPEEHYASDVCTIPFDFAGVPHVSLACGVEKNMPVGLQLATGFFEEQKLFGLSLAVEELL